MTSLARTRTLGLAAAALASLGVIAGVWGVAAEHLVWDIKEECELDRGVRFDVEAYAAAPDDW